MYIHIIFNLSAYYTILTPPPQYSHTQAAGIRVGTLLEMGTGLLAAVVVAFAYSWITAFVILAFLPVLALASTLHFSLVTGQTKSSNKGLKEASEVGWEYN